MILFDFSQIVISSALDYFERSGDEIDMSLLRHISLDRILSIKDRLHKYAEEVVLCLDGRHYWRKTIFPYYKQNRISSREKSKFDWNSFYESFNNLKVEFRENLPYKVIEVEGSEADDIISILCTTFAQHKNIVIVSTDEDFLQLQMNFSPKIQQYSPKTKKFLKPEHNGYNLFEHIVRGDSGDGIGNIFSDDDVFMVKGKRNKSITSVNIEKWSKFGINQPEAFCNNIEDLERFKRNRQIIDLTQIPQHIVDAVNVAYNEAPTNGNNIFNYLIKHQMKKILERAAF